jgi:predicted nucleic acid-binding protein
VIVVADTSVLVNLARVERIDILQTLFHDVIIPPEVATEFGRLAADVARFKGVALPNWIREQSPTIIPAVLRAMRGLDPGESAALSLALEIRADAILIDERRGHSAASQLGLTAVGVFGVLLQAKAKGLVPELRSIIDRLDRDAGFFMSAELREEVLRRAGE